MSAGEEEEERKRKEGRRGRQAREGRGKSDQECDRAGPATLALHGRVHNNGR